MFESIGRGFKMIVASIKMGWQDKRLLLPSILTVLTNISFGLLLIGLGAQKFPQTAKELYPTHGLLKPLEGVPSAVGFAGPNAPWDQSGLQQLGGVIASDTTLTFVLLMLIWWLTNRFLEGVTTALVYSHLSHGKHSGTFAQACSAVFSSLPAIVMLGLVTLIAKRIAGVFRSRQGTGGLTFGFGFMANLVEIFWTLAGHIILPAIVIEGASFWGALKRADKIASGNLLTIGLGEVGVDAICRFTTWMVYLAGLSGFGWLWYAKLSLAHPLVVSCGLTWVATVVLVTAMSIYIRAAFYTCLYAWAVEAEEQQEVERIAPPGPLAAALA